MGIKQSNVYLFLNGRCEEALEFYRINLGAEIGPMMRFSEAPDPPPPGMMPENWGGKIMHSEFSLGPTLLMASDGCGENGKFEGFSLSLAVTTEDAAAKYFNALADGGTIQMPLGKTFWSPMFGMVTDKFGIGWMVNMEAQASL